MLNETFKTEQSDNNFDVDIFFENSLIAKKLNISEKQIEHTSVVDLTCVWSFYIEMRSWGVKSVGAYACDVYSHVEPIVDEMPKNIISLHVEYYETNNDDAELLETTIDVNVNEFEYESVIDNVEDRSMYCPQHIELDFMSKQITVTF